MTAVCGGIVLTHQQSSVQGGAPFFASDITLASPLGTRWLRHTVPCASDGPCVRPALGLLPIRRGCRPRCPWDGPQVARRMRGEMDHDTVRINMARAAALVCLATGIGGLELDAHDYSVMKYPVATEPLAKLANATAPPGASPILVAWPRLLDLLL